jgi:hypothetical protein
VLSVGTIASESADVCSHYGACVYPPNILHHNEGAMIAQERPLPKSLRQ